jgi:hypothetical protein
MCSGHRKRTCRQSRSDPRHALARAWAVSLAPAYPRSAGLWLTVDTYQVAWSSLLTCRHHFFLWSGVSILPSEFRTRATAHEVDGHKPDTHTGRYIQQRWEILCYHECGCLLPATSHPPET